MTLALSTSSPVVSVALADGAGRMLAWRSLEAPWAAGGALGSLTQACIEEAGVGLLDVTRVVADEGPGGFTGVRVGVAFAKGLAWALGTDLALVSAFDLIAPQGDAFVPMKKGEWLLRQAGSTVTQVTSAASPPGKGYGRDVVDPSMPDARNAFLAPVKTVDPVTALPAYHAEPSISRPKDVRILGGSSGCP
ncbi:MAG: tRNA (adenosine(37)-N6)-threonylcarbamoyltransferase complex dimerization subunit type 1 TsaB [Armatimonadetes bacterium]|nr:tRNA (adenosine(37)-N6)-threonylcarbamoyltransferase complex dimerization subunit type 1 TsaB [Armatimonadota bacterium]